MTAHTQEIENRIEFAANAALWHDNLIIQIRFNLKRQTCFVYRKAFQPFTLSMPLNIFEICPTFCSRLQFSTRRREAKSELHVRLITNQY